MDIICYYQRQLINSISIFFMVFLALLKNHFQLFFLLVYHFMTHHYLFHFRLIPMSLLLLLIYQNSAFLRLSKYFFKEAPIENYRLMVSFLPHPIKILIFIIWEFLIFEDLNFPKGFSICPVILIFQNYHFCKILLYWYLLFNLHMNLKNSFL